MKIAVLGWGSLIWNPGNLSIDKATGNNGWNDDGPKLPIEFARISSDGRLTLVIKSGSEEVNTLYAISTYNQLDEAKLDLAIREGCGKNKIASYVKSENAFSDNFPGSKFNTERTTISDWLSEKPNIDAIIWTNLSFNFKDKMGLELTGENVVSYLKALTTEAQAKAEEYIRKAPGIVDTPMRRAIEEKLEWTKM